MGALGFLQSVLNGTVNGATEAGQGLVQGAQDAFNLPRDVYQGKVQTDPRYMSEEEFARTLNLAGNVAGGGITMGTAPEGAIGMFAGRKSQTFPSNKMIEFHKNMGNIPAGETADALYNQTGLFRGKDEMFRYEIPDNGAAVKPEYLRRVMDGVVDDTPVMLRDVLDHPKLFEAYPQLGDLKVQHTPLMPAGTNGSFRPGSDPMIKMNFMSRTNDNPMSTFLHETQHAVQNIEGFAGGANPADPVIQKGAPVQTFRNKANEALAAGNVEDRNYYKQMSDHNAWKAYSREAGEVEARAVERRMGYSPQERQAINPIKEENYPVLAGPHAVPLDQQWVQGKTLPFPAETYNPNLPFLAQYLGK